MKEFSHDVVFDLRKRYEAFSRQNETYAAYERVSAIPVNRTEMARRAAAFLRDGHVMLTMELELFLIREALQRDHGMKQLGDFHTRYFQPTWSTLLKDSLRLLTSSSHP